MASEHEVTRLLSTRGPIARMLGPSFRERPAQMELARLVAQAITTEQHLAAEAGTGCGKTMAYLVAARAADVSAIVATATTALQDQLAVHDLPLLDRAIGPFSWAVLKGASRYLCLRDLDLAHRGQQRGNLDLPSRDELAPVDAACGEPTWDGDLDTVSGLSTIARTAVAADNDRCIGKACPLFTRCYWKAARRQAMEADILVVNQALLGVDLKIGGHVLPPHPVIVVDEAHELADQVRQQLAVAISPTRLSHLLHDIRRAEPPHTPRPSDPGAQNLDGPPAEDADLLSQLGDHLRAVEKVAGPLWDAVRSALEQAEQRTEPGGPGREDLSTELPEGVRPQGRLLVLAVSGVASALRAIGRSDLDADSDEGDEDPHEGQSETLATWRKLVIRAANLAADLRLIFAETDAARVAPGPKGATTDYVRSIGYEPLRTGRRMQQEERRIFVAAQPLDVAPILRERLFERRRVVAVSATLATGPGNLSYFHKQIGMPADALTLCRPWVFDFEKQALLYVPRDLEPVNSGPSTEARAAHERYLDNLAARMLTLVRGNPGGSFLLFTSGQALRDVHARIAAPLLACGRAIFVQGDEPPALLLARFRQTPQAVLFGVKSYWQGVDLPGDALTLVAIDRLPFRPPDDPLTRAEERAVKGAGGVPFTDLMLPRAVLLLKQGLGRLIRSEGDRGVMAVLDSRIHTKGYGREVVRALPPAPETTSLTAVEVFFERMGARARAS